MRNQPHHAFSTARTDAFYINEAMAELLQSYLLNNRLRLAPFEPQRSDSYFELESIAQRIAQQITEQNNRQALYLIIHLKGSNNVIATVNFTNMVFGVFQACHLGFSIDKHYEGQGLMAEILAAALEFVRREYGLHRVMANHLPDNIRSETLLTKLGFEREGFAKSYLKINGQWRDHVLTSYVFAD